MKKIVVVVDFCHPAGVYTGTDWRGCPYCECRGYLKKICRHPKVRTNNPEGVLLDDSKPQNPPFEFPEICPLEDA